MSGYTHTYGDPRKFHEPKDADELRETLAAERVEPMVEIKRLLARVEELERGQPSAANLLPVPRSECPAETEATGQPRPHTWQVFREAGMLWATNRVLHMFGWVIVVCQDEITDEVVDVYPARTTWRGFSAEAEARGHERVSEWMAKAGDALRSEST